jgi:hypothetical protein
VFLSCVLSHWSRILSRILPGRIRSVPVYELPITMLTSGASMLSKMAVFPERNTNIRNMFMGAFCVAQHIVAMIRISLENILDWPLRGVAICLSVCLSIQPPVRPSVRPSNRLSVRPSVRLTVPSDRPSIPAAI